jgi:DNA-binding transcriptional LysR family regulator
MDLELAWLRSWLAVVDSGGFARAADRIHLSEPRISAHIAGLARALGCSLIERRLRPLTLTDAGKRLMPRAGSIIASVDDTISDRRV